jgi:hypothetical protein
MHSKETHSEGTDAKIVFDWVVCVTLISAFTAGEEKEGGVVFRDNIDESGEATGREGSSKC